MPQTERLLLQVDAATELLRRHLTEAEPALDRFEKRAAKMGANVDRSIADMGSRFGAFATLAETAAERAEKSFEASFTQVQRIAATAIKGPTIDGRINLGADDIRAGAAAAAEQARAFALIGEAAERVAREVGDTTEATRLFIAATAASRIEAEQKASALLAEAGALERVEIELRQSADATDLFVSRHQQIALAAEQDRQLAEAANAAAIAERALAAAADLLRADIDPMYAAQKRFNDELDRAEALLAAGSISEREYGQAVQVSRERLYEHAAAITGNVSPTRSLVASQGQLRNASQQLSYQISDVATSFAGGISPMVIFAQQGSQVVQAITLMKAEAGGLIGFLGGPWGAVILGAVSIIGVLATKHGEAAGASKIHAEAENGLKDAVDRLNGSAAALNHTTRQGIIDDLNAAEAARQHELRVRGLLDAQLALAKGKLQSARTTEQTGAGQGSVPGAIVSQAGAQIAAAQEQISAIEGAQAINDKKRGDAERAIRVAQGKITLRDVAAATDAATAATQRYDDTLDKLERRFQSGLISQDAFRKGALDAKGVEQRTQAAIQESKKKPPKGPSEETLAKRAETARVKVLSDDSAYTDEERQARHRLLDATRKTTASEQQRDQLIRDDINAEADATTKKIANDLSAHKISQAEADHLSAINDATRKQRLQNVDIDRASSNIADEAATARQSVQSQIAIEQLRAGMATTVSARRAAELRILDLTEKLEIQAQQAIVDDPKTSDADRKRAQQAIATVREQHDANVTQVNQQNAGPLDQYRQRLHAATDDMKESLQGVAVDGLQGLEDGLLGIIDGTESVGSAFKKMASSIISDLARIAIEKAIVSAIGGGFFGFAGGGSVGNAPGYADGGALGGLIRGPGTGRSDSVLALLKGPNGGAVRLSNREFIMNAAAVEHYGADAMQAINARRFPRFADGGLLGPMPSVRLREPRLPNMAGSRRDRLAVDVRTKVEASPLLLASVQETTIRTVEASAAPIMDGATTQTLKKLNRPDLPGGYG